MPYDEALKIRKTNLSKGLFAYYKDHVMVHKGKYNLSFIYYYEVYVIIIIKRIQTMALGCTWKKVS